MINKELHISIVIYNQYIFELKDLLNNLLKTDIDLLISILDNSNNVYKIQNNLFIKKHFPSINYIPTHKNLGFAKAHNIALKESVVNKYKYHLVLNPDILISKNSLEILIEFLSKNKNVGMITPKILNFDGSLQYNCRLLPSPYILFARRFLKLEKINYVYELRFTGYKQIMKVPWICGCFMLINTTVLRDIGLFDERFFLYMEDIDFSRRFYRKADIIFYPYTFVYHKAQRGSYKNFKLLKLHIESAIKYFNKWGWIFDKERELINKEVLENLEWRCNSL